MMPNEIPEGCVHTSGSEDGYGEFTCAMCKETWVQARSLEAAMEEYKERFPFAAAASEPTEIICHDCFQQLEYYRQNIHFDDLEMPEA